MKMQLFALASGLLVSEAAALIANAHHRHGHQHFHNKKDIVYQYTEVVTETDWVTVTVYEDNLPTSTPAAPPAPTTTSSANSMTRSRHRSRPTPSSAPSVPPTPPQVAPPAPATSAPATSTPPAPSPVAPKVEVNANDIKPQPAPTPEAKPSPAPAPAPAVQQQAPPPPPPAPKSQAPPPPPAPQQSPPPPAAGNSGGSGSGSGSSGSGGSSTPSGNKRGLAYNDAKLTAPFLGSGSKCSWAYNWGQTPDGLSNPGVDYVPMLWGPIDMHTSTWQKNANNALNNGAKHLLSFNECDNAGQCNKSPAEAAAAHIKWMNPFGDRAAISSPAITNSNIPGQGVDWLKQWVRECNGQCKFDFCAAHWYSPANPADLLGHLDDVHDACQGKPVWLTEFAPISGDKTQFLADVMKELDTNKKYSYVQRYSYFMVAVGGDNLLASATSINDVGKVFAYQ